MTDIGNSNWSQTDSSNTTLFAEGQLARSVNDGMRTVQGAIKRTWVWDHPTVTSTGSANTHELTYDVVPESLYQGITFRFIAGFTNTGSATLNVNSLGAITINAHGSPLTGAEIKTGVIAVVAYDGTNWQLLNPEPMMREKLIANKIFYVDASEGSDDSGDGSAGNPWQTIQFAYNWIVQYIDAAGFAVTISQQNEDTVGLLADFPITGAPFINLVLNGSINTANSAGIRVFRQGGLSISGTGSITAANQCVVCQNGGFMQVAGITFGACAGAQIYAQLAGQINLVGSYSIAGNAAEHWLCDSNSNITAFPASGTITVTLNGTRAFTTFAFADTAGTIQADHSVIAFSGSATGSRYFVSTNSTIQTGGGGASFFPGDSAGNSDAATFGVFA